MFDASAYCVAVYGTPLSYQGGEPSATPPDRDHEASRTDLTDLPDPWEN